MKKAIIFIYVLFVIFLTGAKDVIHAQDKTPPSCVSAQCHATMGKAKYVHGPIANGDCTTCHELLSNETHKFKAIKDIGALCYNCHDPMGTKKYVHPPVMKGQCTTCHDPHQSDYKYQIKKEPISQICFSCHKQDIMSKKFKHGPAADGDCTVCHTPHTSDDPKFLLQTGDSLCFQCHVDMKDEFSAAKFVHKPAGENCINCHSPHSNDAKYMLSNDAPALCYNCHKDIKDHVAQALVKHGALDMQQKCLNCHSPHVSQYPKMLKDQPMSLCLGCHNQPLKATDGTMLTDMKTWLDQNKDWHGPIKEKDCSACHDPHGSANFRILRK